MVTSSVWGILINQFSWKMASPFIKDPMELGAWISGGSLRRARIHQLISCSTSTSCPHQFSLYLSLIVSSSLLLDPLLCFVLHLIQFYSVHCALPALEPKYRSLVFSLALPMDSPVLLYNYSFHRLPRSDRCHKLHPHAYLHTSGWEWSWLCNSFNVQVNLTLVFCDAYFKFAY